MQPIDAQTTLSIDSHFKRFNPRTSIAGRLMVWFLIIAVVSCGVLAWILYLLSSRSLQETYRERLSVVALRKSAALETYAVERLRSATVIARGESTVAVAAAYRSAAGAGATSPAFLQANARYRPALAFATDLYGYPDAFLLSTDGVVLFALNGRVTGLEQGANLLTGPLQNSELAGVFDRVSTLLQEEVSDFQVYPGMIEPVAFVAAPVIDSGAVTGVLILQLGNEELYEILSDAAGLGDTGETQAATRIDNEAVIVAPLRHDPDAAFTRREPIGSANSTAIQRAVQGQAGYGAITDYRGVVSLAVWSYIPSFRWGLVIKQDTAEALSLIATQRRVTLWLLLGMVVPLALIALAVARSISLPLGFAAKAAADVAKGDLTGRFETTRLDETGLLLRALHQMIESLNLLLGQVKRSSSQLDSAAIRISTTAKAQEASVADVSTSTHEIASAVTQISATGQELERTMTHVSVKIGETAALADVGQTGLTRMHETMKKMEAASTAIAEKLATINAKVANITTVVTTITKVADQTNLLSLNAGIEAAKAGEFGQGFAVVAREIRRLADQTAVATLDIEQIVKEMQSSVSAGVMSMEKFAQDVQGAVHEVQEVSGQLGHIIDEVQQLTPQFEAVTEGMQSQSAGARQISEAMVELTTVTQSTSSSVQEFMQANDELRTVVEGLQQEISRFNTAES